MPKGAGRPPVYDGPGRSVNLYLTEANLGWLKHLQEKAAVRSTSAYLNHLLERLRTRAK